MKKKIKEIMTKEVITVLGDSSVLDVSKLIAKHRIHGIPVVDKNKKLIGIVTESDFFIKDLDDFYLPSFINFVSNTNFAHQLQKQWKKDLLNVLNAKAKDIMTEDCVTISEEENLKDLLKIYQEYQIYTVPVADKNKKLKGVVTVSDLLKNI